MKNYYKDINNDDFQLLNKIEKVSQYGKWKICSTEQNIWYATILFQSYEYK